jgi:hypothetical protein
MMVVVNSVVMMVVAGESRHRCGQQQNSGQHGDP